MYSPSRDKYVLVQNAGLEFSLICMVIKIDNDFYMENVPIKISQFFFRDEGQ